MSILQTLRAMRPYQLLLLAALGAIVLAQIAAFVMVTRSQVQKAEAFYAAEQQARPSARAAITATGETALNNAAPAPRNDVMHVGYVVSR